MKKSRKMTPPASADAPPMVAWSRRRNVALDNSCCSNTIDGASVRDEDLEEDDNRVAGDGTIEGVEEVRSLVLGVATVVCDVIEGGSVGTLDRVGTSSSRPTGLIDGNEETVGDALDAISEATDGSRLGETDGIKLGSLVGSIVGANDGDRLGLADGPDDGTRVGRAVGVMEGECVGGLEGTKEGAEEENSMEICWIQA